MNRVELLIKEKIGNADSSLDLQHLDQKMFQLACKDFTNYMKFNCKTSQNIHFQEKSEKLSRRELSEIKSFLAIWSAMWTKKWQQRVKLLIGKQHRNELFQLYQTLDEAQPLWQTLDCKKELIEIVMSTLINNGEICGAEILAEHTLKLELAKNILDTADKVKTVTFLNNVMRRAHEIAKTSGPLMFIEVSKTYYNSATNLSTVYAKRKEI